MLAVCLYFHGFALSFSSVLSKNSDAVWLCNWVPISSYMESYLQACWPISQSAGKSCCKWEQHSWAGKAIKVQAAFFCHKQGREKSNCALSRKMKAMPAMSGEVSVLQHGFPRQAKNTLWEEGWKYFKKNWTSLWMPLPVFKHSWDIILFMDVSLKVVCFFGFNDALMFLKTCRCAAH